MATVSAVDVPALEAMTTGTPVAVGDTGEITRTGNIYVCIVADGTGSAWIPGDNVWRVRDFTTLSTTSWVQEACNRADGSQAGGRYSSQTGGIVEMGAGVWSANVRVTLRGGIHLRGLGPRVTLVRLTALATEAFFTAQVYSGAPTVFRVTCSDFAIDHASAGAPGSAGVNFQATQFPIAQNVEVRNLAEYGIRFGEECQFGRAHDCDVRGSADAFLFENGARSCWAVGSITKAAAVGFQFREGLDAGVSNCGVVEGAAESFTDAGVETTALTPGGVFKVTARETRLETSGAGTIGARIGADSRFTALLFNHYQGTLPGGKVVDNSGDDGELFSIENPVTVGMKMGNLAGTRFARLRGAATDPNGTAGEDGDFTFTEDEGGTVYSHRGGPASTSWARVRSRNKP